MRFLLRKDPRLELKRMLRSGRACLALFAAAAELKLGFVQGVPPHIYVQRLGPANLAAWKNVTPAEPGEVPDIILRQAPAPQSIFRGLVRANELSVCDVLQIWLDVSAHPTRGREQADFILNQVLGTIINARRSRG